MLNDGFTLDARRVLRLLARLRWVVAFAYAAGIALGAVTAMEIAVWAWLVPAALIAANLWLSRPGRRTATATPARIGRHLAGDTLALFALLWASGGATNPFVSLFLVPVAIAGVTLPPRHAAAITGGCMAGYTVLLLRYLQTGGAHVAMTGFQTHIVGMWLNFVLAAILLCVFLLAVSAALRARERELAAQRERLLRDDAIVSVATLAAGAAHALNTPLGTIALAAESLDGHPDLPGELREDVDTINAQVGLCARQLRQLVDAHRPGEARALGLADYAADVIARWRARRPEIDSHVTGLEALPNARLRDDPALSQALMNLLDNAADASMAADSARVAVAWACEPGTALRGAETLALIIDDDGRDADHATLDGLAFASTKPDGLGLGLTLARAGIVRLGGRLTLTRAPAGGTRTEIRLPLAALADDLAAGSV